MVLERVVAMLVQRVESGTESGKPAAGNPEQQGKPVGAGSRTGLDNPVGQDSLAQLEVVADTLEALHILVRRRQEQEVDRHQGAARSVEACNPVEEGSE